MSARTLSVSEPIYQYLLDNSLRETEASKTLRKETLRLAEARMQISPEQGQFMALLIQMMGAERAIEVGTFTGYSALVVALALPETGQLVACDLSEEWTSIGKPFWAADGVAHNIDLRIAPAIDTLNALLADGEAGQFDFAFIDADKGNYVTYYELCLSLIRPGGVIAVDNVLWSGDVADPRVTDTDTEAIRALNQRIHRDERVTMSMVPIGDGLTLVRKLG